MSQNTIMEEHSHSVQDSIDDEQLELKGRQNVKGKRITLIQKEIVSLICGRFSQTQICGKKVAELRSELSLFSSMLSRLEPVSLFLELRRGECYMDGNLDWSFLSLTPQMVKLLKQDRTSFLKRRSDMERKSNTFHKGIKMRRLSPSLFLQKQPQPHSYPGKLNEESDSALEDYEFWQFNIFRAATVTGYQVLIPLTMKIFISHDLLQKFNIDPIVFEQFLIKVERHYRRNPYHNSLHAGDVVQTANSIITQTGFAKIMNDFEIFCLLFASLMHDIEHTGTNNKFHRNTRSEMAKLYMVSILENHHLRVAIGMLRLYDLLSCLTETEVEEFKDLLGSLILSTDMANHFLLITNMKILSNAPTRCDSRIRIRRIMLLILHAADISNPCKPWPVHKIWVSLLCQEFFDQGDKERNMNLPISPNCDKKTVNIAALQIGFMQTFALEAFEVLYQLIDKEMEHAGVMFVPCYPWLQFMNENAGNWNKNWSSLKFALINEFLAESAKPRMSFSNGEPIRVSKQKKGWWWWCCCCYKSEKHLFRLAEISTTTV